MTAAKLVPVIARRAARGREHLRLIHIAPDTPTGNGFRPICGAVAGDDYAYAVEEEARHRQCPRCATRAPRYGRRGGGRTHGRRSTYRVCTLDGGRACQKCRDAEADYAARWRLETGRTRRPQRRRA